MSENSEDDFEQNIRGVQSDTDGESRVEIRGRVAVAVLIMIVCHNYFSKIMIKRPSTQSNAPSTPLSYFSRNWSLSFSIPASVSHVNTTMPATVATDNMSVSSTKPLQP